MPTSAPIVRYAGAAYLLVLGFRAWRQPGEHEPDATPRRGGHCGAHGRRLMVQLLNPTPGTTRVVASRAGTSRASSRSTGSTRTRQPTCSSTS